jgi:hypothetical protein
VSATPTLTAEIADFIQSGVSITVGSRDDRLVPSIAKGVGCRVADGLDQVSVYVFERTAQAVVRDILRSGLAAVVFTQPSSHRTVQLKARAATVAASAPADVALVRRWLAAFAGDLRPFGWDQDFVDAVFWDDDSALLQVRFAPDTAFQQTPGPDAGRALPLQAGRSP